LEHVFHRGNGLNEQKKKWANGTHPGGSCRPSGRFCARASTRAVWAVWAVSRVASGIDLPGAPQYYGFVRLL